MFFYSHWTKRKKYTLITIETIATAVTSTTSWSPMADSKKVFKLIVGALALSLAVLLVPLSSAFGEGGFRAGNIISDANMYQATPSLSQAEIQKFLDTQGASCSGNGCLKNLRFNTSNIAADHYCPGAYQGANNEPVSQIIYKVSQACHINPKVLLVTIQKEQSGLTRNLTEVSQRTLMGYGCPDGRPCEQLYYGVQNQIYRAARQFQLYRVNPTSYAYSAGATRSIKYAFNCGASNVRIENQATASLYNYTPYQPNQALLSGGRDSCSSDGNYNFFNMYSKWFGDPRSSVPATPASNPVPVQQGGNTGTASNTKQQAAKEAGGTQLAIGDNLQNKPVASAAGSAAANTAANASSTTASGSLASSNGSATSSAPTPATQSAAKAAENTQASASPQADADNQAKAAQNTAADTSAQDAKSQGAAQSEAQAKPQTVTSEVGSQPQKTLSAKQETATANQGGNPGLASTGTVGGSAAILAIALVIAGWRIRQHVLDNRPIRVNC